MAPSEDGSSQILVRQAGGSWTVPATSSVDSELELQKLIAGEPTLVPGVESGSVAVTEFRSAVGPADVCIVGPDGSVTIVECKLASNAEVRRKIVGQILDYASQIWGLSFLELDRRWRQRNSDIGLRQSLPNGVPGLESQIEANLQSGSFDLVLAVDQINPDLRRIIEYLNHITSSETSVVALELSYAKQGDVEILVPSIYGAELAASKGLAEATSAAWQPADVLNFLAAHEPQAHLYVAGLFELAAADGWMINGTAAKEPSAIIGKSVEDGEIWPLTIYCQAKGSLISTNFQWTHRAPELRRREFLKAMAVFSGVDEQGVLEAKYRKRPGHPIAEFQQFLPLEALRPAMNALASEEDETGPGSPV